MEGKKSFIVYTSWYDFLEDLSNEQKGMWLDWMMRYTNDEWDNKEIVYPTDPMVKMACKMVKDTLKRDLDSWKEQKAKRSEAGKKGMAIRWHSNDIANDNTTITKDNSVINANNKDITKITDNVNVNVNVNDNVNVLSKDNDILCAEMGETISTLPAIKCPKGHEKGFNVYEKDIEKWQQVYIGVDVKHELEKMRLWLESNPKSRKTYNGMPKFINNWLSRAQDQASKFNRNNQAPTTPEQPQLLNGGFEIVDTKPSETPYEVANTIKTLHLNDKQAEQWLSAYTDEFSQEVRKYL